MASPAPAPRLETVSVLTRLAHDLMQPLSAIEATTYYLEMILPRDDPRVRPQLDQLRRLVHELGAMVNSAAIEGRQDRDSRPERAEARLPQTSLTRE